MAVMVDLHAMLMAVGQRNRPDVGPPAQSAFWESRYRSMVRQNRGAETLVML